jgi:hypothetical protein
LTELFIDAESTNEVILAFEEQYKDIGCQVGRGHYENHQENQLDGFRFRTPTFSEHKIIATTNDFS